MKQERINPSVCYILGVSLLFTAIFLVAIYIICGVIEVPEASPLSDSNFIVQPLNEELSPTSNQLYGGENFLAHNFLSILISVLIVFLFALKRETLWGCMIVAIAYMYLASHVLGEIAKITFDHGNILRADAQLIIEENHSLRVAIAYIGILAEKHSTSADNLVTFIAASILLTSLILAGATHRLFSSHKKTTQTIP